MSNQKGEKESIPLWQIAFLTIILLLALVSLGTTNATLNNEYHSTVEQAKKALQERDERIEGLELNTDKLEKDNKQLKQRLESKRPQTNTYIVKASEKQMWGYFVKRFGYSNGRIMFAVCKSESGLNPEARNDDDTRITGYPSLGVCQINGPENWDWKNYKANIDKAYYVKFLNGGFTHWTDYRNGYYLKYL